MDFSPNLDSKAKDVEAAPVEVVAALIRDGGRFLICRRPAHKARGLLWEFPGGKVEAGETKERALARECREELGVELAVGAPFMDVTHEYPDVAVHVTLFEAAVVSGRPRKIEHEEIRWITAEEIPLFDFCPADRAFLEKLRRGARA